MAKIISYNLESEQRNISNLRFGLLVFLLVFIVARTILISVATYSPLTRNKDPQCADFLLCEYLRSINQSASQGDRVLTLSAYRYYLRDDLFACSTKNEEYLAIQKLSTNGVTDFWTEVYRQGYTYIVYEHEYATRHLRIDFIPNPQNAPKWMALEKIYNSDTNIIAAYKINITGEAPAPREKTCAQNNGIWEVQNIILK
jgi:hypothetical protein